MPSPAKTARILRRGTHEILDVLGPTVEFLNLPESDAGYCVMIGTIPPGVSVPLHSHADVESFYLLSGSVQVLSQKDDSFEWLTANAGEFVHVSGGAKHAFRNTSSEPVVELITTTPKIGRFFQEVGKPLTPGASPKPPTPEDIQRFMQVSASYHYWNASPEENAAVGIFLG
jgi:quercetin dioxygenase-like cupin family protein